MTTTNEKTFQGLDPNEPAKRIAFQPEVHQAQTAEAMPPPPPRPPQHIAKKVAFQPEVQDHAQTAEAISSPSPSLSQDSEVEETHEDIDINFTQMCHVSNPRDYDRRARYVRKQQKKRQCKKRRQGRRAYPQGGGLADYNEDSDDEEFDDYFDTDFGLEQLFRESGKFRNFKESIRESLSRRFGSSARASMAAGVSKKSTLLLKSCSKRFAADVVVVDTNQAQLVLVRVSGMITALAQANTTSEMFKIALGIGCQYVSGKHLKWLNKTISDSLVIPQDSSLTAIRTSIDGFQHFLTTVEEVPCFAMLKNTMLLCMYAGFQVSDYCADNSLLKEYLSNFDKSVPLTTLGPLNFLQVTSAMMSFTLEFIEVISTGASIRNFLFPSTVLSRFAELTAKKDHWKTGDLVKLHGLTAIEYLKELTKLDADIDLSIKKAPSSLKATYLSYSRVIKSLVNEVRAGNMIQKLKVKGIGVVYTGDSQIGKSAIITNTRGIIGAAVGSDLSDKNTYYVKLGSKYMSGLTNETRCIVFDDVDALNDKLKPVGSSAPVFGIHYVNGTPAPTEQAEIEFKGKIFPNADLVVMSSNSHDAGALTDLKHAEAFINRFYFVEVVVKDHCRIPGTTKLDSTRIPKDSNGRPLSAHDVRVYTFVNTGKGYRRVNGEWTDISQYYAWLGKLAKKQYKSEKSYVDSIENIWNLKRCSSCFLPEYSCICGNDRGIILPDCSADSIVRKSEPVPTDERSRSGRVAKEKSGRKSQENPSNIMVRARKRFIAETKRSLSLKRKLTPAQREKELDLLLSEYDEEIESTQQGHLEMIMEEDQDLDVIREEGFAEIKGMITESGNFYVSLIIKYLALVKVPSVSNTLENAMTSLFLRFVGAFVRNFKHYPDLGKFVYCAVVWIQFRIIIGIDNPYWRWFFYTSFGLYWYLIVACLSKYCRILIYEEVKNSIRNRSSSFVHVGTAGVAVYAVIQAIAAFSRTYEKRQPEGNLMPKSAEDIKERAREQDCWSEVELLKKKAPGKVESQTLSAVLNNVGKNTIRWECAETGECCMGLMINSQTLLVAHHSCKKFRDRATCAIKLIRNPGKLSSSCDTFVSNYRQLRNSDNKPMDYGVWQIAKILPMADVMMYFNRRENKDIDGVCTMITKSRKDSLPIKHRTINYQQTTVDNTVIKGPGSMHMVKEPTEQGDCTSPIVTHTRPHLIVGMHCASNMSTRAYAFTICREDVEEAIARFPKADELMLEGGIFIPQAEYGALRDAPHGVDLIPVQDLHPNSNVRYVAQNGTPDVWFECHGDVPGLRVKPKTRVQFSPMSQYYEAAGLRRKHTKPKFAADRDHSEYFQIGIRGMSDIDPTLLAWAQRDYIAPLLESFTKLKHPTTRVLSLQDALNGIRDLRYIKRINEKTSGGLGYSGQKTQHMETDYVKGVKTFTPSEYLERDVEAILTQLSKGKMVGPVGKTCLKDEPVKDQIVDLEIRRETDPSAELKVKRNRVFFVYDFAFFIVGKMLFISVIECLYAVPLLCEMLQGCNVTTDEWTQIREFAIGWNPNKVLEGDFRKMDTCLSGQLITASGAVLTTLARHMGYTETELTMMQTYVHDLALSVYAYNGTIVVLGGWNPSGNILTIVINGIANSLMHRCAYKQQLDELKRPILPFRDCIHLATVGDDSLGSVIEECPFSMASFQLWCASRNMGYTDGKKNKVAMAYQDWKDATLCKRQFRWEERVKNYVAPLALDSLYKSLHCQMESTTDAMTIAIGNADSALRELARHDEAVFLFHRERIKKAFVSANADHLVPHLDLSYEDWWSILKKRHYVFPEEGPDIPDSSDDLEEDE